MPEVGHTAVDRLPTYVGLLVAVLPAEVSGGGVHCEQSTGGDVDGSSTVRSVYVEETFEDP